jgi:hypothetical protein
MVPRRSPGDSASSCQTTNGRGNDADERRAPGATAYHPLVFGVREFFDVDRVSEFGYLRPTNRLLVDLVVSKPMLSTALGAANELFLSLEDRGHRVILAPYGRYYHRLELVLEGVARQAAGYAEPWHPARPTVFYIGSVAFGLTLYEASEPVEVQHAGDKYVPVAQVTEDVRRRLPSWEWTTTQYPPSGRLTLRAYSPDGSVSWQKEWSEAKQGDLPHSFQTIRRELRRAVPEIEALLEKARLEAEQRSCEWEVEQAKRGREERERREKEAYKETIGSIGRTASRGSFSRHPTSS